MGCASSRCRDIRLLWEEIEETRRARQREAREYERRLAAAEEEERRRHEKEEAARLRNAVKQDIYRRPRYLDSVGGGEDDGAGVKEWRRFSRGCGGSGSVVEQARREETVEKWKQLYLTIKTELDELIHRTREEGGRSGRGSEESKRVEELQRELREKEESVEALTSHIAAMQKEAFKKDRQNDILRQCLRILGSNTNRDLHRTKRQFNKKSLVS